MSRRARRLAGRPPPRARAAGVARRVDCPHPRRRVERGPRAPRARAGTGRRSNLHRPRSRQGPLPPRALSLQAVLDLDRRRSPQRRARADRSLGRHRRSTRSQRASLALALLPPAARLGGCAGGRRAGARAGPETRRSALHGPQLLPGVDHRRAQRAVDPRALARGARQGAVRGTGRSAQRRPPAEQSRRPPVPAREACRGSRSPEGGVQRRRSRSTAKSTPRRRSPRWHRFISAAGTSSRPRSRRGMR